MATQVCGSGKVSSAAKEKKVSDLKQKTEITHSLIKKKCTYLWVSIFCCDFMTCFALEQLYN